MDSSLSDSLLCPPCVAFPNTTLVDAFTLLDQGAAHCLLIMECDRLLGIVTAGDIIRHLAKGRSPKDTTLSEVMTHPVICLQKTELINPSVAIAHFQQHHIRYLPIVEGDRVLGVITRDQVQDILWSTLQETPLDPAVPTKAHSAEAETSICEHDPYVQLLYTLIQSLSLANNLYADLETISRDILQSIPDLLIRVNHQGEYLDVLSEGTFTDISPSSPHLKSPAVHDVLLEAIANQQVDFICRAIETGELQRYEQSVHFNGDLRWTEVRIAPLSDTEALMIVRDITERKQIDIALRQSEAQFRSTFEQAAVGIGHSALNGRFLRVNQRFCDILGYSEAELIQLTFQVITHPNDLEMDLDYVGRLVAGEIETYTLEKRYVHKNGEPIWINLTVSLLRSPAEEPQYFISVIEDITERKYTEAALRQSEAVNRAIVESMPDLLIRVDQEGHHIEMLHGTSVKEVLKPRNSADSHTVFDVLTHDLATQRAKVVQRARETQSLQVYEQEISLNGETCWEEVRVTPINETEVLVIIRDITDRKQSEQAIYQLNQELEYRVAQRTKALSESEERWQLALQSYDAGIWDRNFRHNATFRSQRWKEIRGLDENDVGEDNAAWSSRIHPSDRDRVLAALDDYITHKAASYQEEYRVWHKDGYYIWIQDRGKALWDENGNIVRMVGAEIDITERKRAESKAQLFQERLHFLLSTSPVMIYACKLDALYNTKFISENVIDLLGYTSDEWLADPGLWMRLLHPDDALKILKKRQPLLDIGYSSCEYRILNKTGQYRWILDGQKLIRDEYGEPIEVVGYMADISDRKETELRLQSQKQFLRQLLDTIPHLIFVKDRDGRFVLANRAIANFYNTTVERLIGNTSGLFNPNSAEVANFQLADRAVIDSGIPCVVEETLTSAQGYQGYFQTVKVPIPSFDGQTYHMLGIATNITPRKQIEDQLRKSEAHLSTAQRIAKLGSWEFDFRSQTIQWSAQTYEIFGRTPSDQALTYAEFRDCVHPDDLKLVDQTVQIITEQQQPFELEYRIYHTDGQIRYILSRADLVMDSSEQPYKLIGTVFDITDRRKAEIQLQKMNEQLALTNAELDRATHLKDEFLANMSHELRTPLNAILGMAEGLQDNVFGLLSDCQKQSIEMIEHSGKHLLELINDILDLSKISAGKLELQCTPVPIKYLCDSSLNFVQQQAAKKEIAICLEMPNSLPPITVDELRIRQVLINLLNNAVKFTPEGGQVTLAVAPELQNNQLLLRFAVSDTGIGIAGEDLEKLFQPFVQLDSNLNRQQSGTGLGLVLVRRLVELHDGMTAVTSTLGQGSCFTVWLPYITSQSVEAITPLTTTSMGCSQPIQVFIVIDSVAASEPLMRCLENMGMEVVAHQRREDIVRLVVECQPKLMILDGLSLDQSVEILNALKAHSQIQGIPVIIVSEIASEIGSEIDARSHCLSLGAADYLVKPVSEERLRETCQRLVQQQETSSAVAEIAYNTSPITAAAPLILLVEDNDLNSITISSYLTARGYCLITAQNGYEAIAQTQSHQPDLILMDVQMPGIDGLEVIRYLRTQDVVATIPIIAITALTMPGDRDRCLEAGANHYLSKPVKLKQLLELIQQSLKNRCT